MVFAMLGPERFGKPVREWDEINVCIGPGVEPARHPAQVSRTPGDLWVFGYGSLMWRPGFAYLEAMPARVTGYHRSLCVYSIHYRGGPRHPGLVLGLDRGGMCDGVAFRVAAEDREAVLGYLRARELIYSIYREVTLPARIAWTQGAPIRVVTYVVERAHPAYAGDLSLPRQARIIAAAKGSMGTNREYLNNTLRHLCEQGLRERGLERISRLVASGYGGARVGGHNPFDAKALRRFSRQELARLGFRKRLSHARFE